MAKPLFEDAVDAIFAKAGIGREGNEDVYQEANRILHQSMAYASVTLGISKKRIGFFDKQKRTLVQDLLAMKAEGRLS